MPARRKLALAIGRRSGTSLQAEINVRRLSNGLEAFKEYFDDTHCDQTSGKVDASKKDCHAIPVERRDVVGNTDPTMIQLPAVPGTGETDKERTGGSGERSSRQSQDSSQQSTRGLRDASGVKNRKRFQGVYLRGLPPKSQALTPSVQQGSNSRRESANVQSLSMCLPSPLGTPILCSTRLSECSPAPGSPRYILHGDSLLDGCLPAGGLPSSTVISHDALSRQPGTLKANTDKRRDSLKPSKSSSSSSGSARPYTGASEQRQHHEAVTVQQTLSPSSDDIPSAPNCEGKGSCWRSESKTAAPLESLATGVQGQEMVNERDQQGDASCRLQRRNVSSNLSCNASNLPQRSPVKEKTVSYREEHRTSNAMSDQPGPEAAAPAKSTRTRRGDKVTVPADKPPTVRKRPKKSSHPTQVDTVHKVARVENNEGVLRPQCDRSDKDVIRTTQGSVPETLHSSNASSSGDEESHDQVTSGGNPLMRSAMQEVQPLSSQRRLPTLKERKMRRQPLGAVVVGGDPSIHRSTEEFVPTQKSISRILQNAPVSPTNRKTSEKALSLQSPATSPAASPTRPKLLAQDCSPAQNTNVLPRQQLQRVRPQPSVLPVTQTTKEKSIKRVRSKTVENAVATQPSKGRDQPHKREVATMAKAAQNQSDLPSSSTGSSTSLRRGTRTRQPPPPRDGLYVPVYEYTKEGPVFKRYQALANSDLYVQACSVKAKRNPSKVRHTKEVSDTTASKVPPRKRAKRQPAPCDSVSAATVKGPGLLDFLETSHVRDITVQKAESYKFISEDQSENGFEISTQYLLMSCHTGFIRIYPGKAKEPADLLYNNVIFIALDNPVRVSTSCNIVTKLSKGDSCLVPKGTSYSIENLSQDHGAELHFTLMPNF
ncbi:uncharacterized protein LOC135368708 [Ornithodoros turicata]|uniref:uncharacterized protein LOC135368708 n=1 Tax=Ornithodoros turicata TaxID=34597 RepID=UPI003139E5CB